MRETPAWRSERWTAGIQDTAKYVQDSKSKLGSLLSGEQREILRQYLDNGYALDNQLIRGGLQSADQYKAIIHGLVRDGLGVNALLFRGLSDHTLVEVGAKYVDAAPGSASVTMDRALQLASQGESDGQTGVCLHILGATAANVSGASLLRSEYEALILPDESFDVVFKEFDRERGIYHAGLQRAQSSAIVNTDVLSESQRGFVVQKDSAEEEEMVIEDDGASQIIDLN